MLIWFSFATTCFSSSGMFACAPPSAPSARAVWRWEASPTQAILEQVVGALERLGAVARDLDVHVQREQLEVRLSQVADQRQPHAAPRLLGGQQVRARGLVGSADAPPMSSSHWAESAPKKKFVVVLRHLGRDPERGHGVATAGDVEVVADLREELRARHPDPGARFLDAGGGDPHVVVAGERFLDEVLQDGVLERLPPRQVRERRRLLRRLAAERRDLGHGRTLVVRADRAAGEQRRGDDRAPGRPGPHGRTPPAGGSPSGPAGDRRRRGHRRRRRWRADVRRNRSAHVERDRDDEDRDDGGGEHAADHGRAEDVSRVGAGAGRHHERKHAEDEGEGRHEDRPQADAGARERGVDQGRAALVLDLRELHDQDRVLGREADHHDQADLREHVQLEMGEPERGDGAEDRDGRAEQHAKRQRPAFVQCGQQQEHDEQGEAEDGSRRDALRGHLLLERHAGVVEAHLAGHGLREDLLERLHALAAADAGREDAVDLRRPVLVEAHGELRAVDRFHGDERRQWHRLVARVAHIELRDGIRPRPEIPLGLDVHLPDPPELVEVVHEGAAHERLQRLVDRREIDALLEHLVPVDVGEELGHARAGTW